MTKSKITRWTGGRQTQVLLATPLIKFPNISLSSSLSLSYSIQVSFFLSLSLADLNKILTYLIYDSMRGSGIHKICRIKIISEVSYLESLLLQNFGSPIYMRDLEHDLSVMQDRDQSVVHFRARCRVKSISHNNKLRFSIVLGKLRFIKIINLDFP